MLRERNPYAYRCHLHNKLTAVYNAYVQYVYIILYMRCIPVYYIHACAHNVILCIYGSSFVGIRSTNPKTIIQKKRTSGDDVLCIRTHTICCGFNIGWRVFIYTYHYVIRTCSPRVSNVVHAYCI